MPVSQTIAVAVLEQVHHTATEPFFLKETPTGTVTMQHFLAKLLVIFPSVRRSHHSLEGFTFGIVTDRKQVVCEFHNALENQLLRGAHQLNCRICHFGNVTNALSSPLIIFISRKLG